MHVFHSINTQRYAKCIEVSKRVRWDIERDVIRGRDFDANHKFLPDGLSFADRFQMQCRLAIAVIEIDAAGDDATKVANLTDISLQLFTLAKKILRSRGGFTVSH